jgi:hypothetical protein
MGVAGLSARPAYSRNSGFGMLTIRQDVENSITPDVRKWPRGLKFVYCWIWNVLS